jgi:hypothetical protein
MLWAVYVALQMLVERNETTSDRLIRATSSRTIPSRGSKEVLNGAFHQG